MAAPKTKAASRASTSPDIEDLFAKHPDVRSVIERAPEARRALLDWYDENHRVLPWRRNAFSKHCEPTDAVTDADDASRAMTANEDPVETAKLYWRLDHLCATRGAARDVPTEQYAYGVWVSEIMSQQTQIERVATYWRRWMAKWPTVHALADATQEEVNEMWAGLGYYRRARFLLEGARRVARRGETGEKKSGNETSISTSFPRTSEALGGIPGVGPYTAAAVASIAFGEPVAAVDGNVIRVAARLAAARGGGDAAKSGTSAAAAVRAVADALLSRERPGDFNQAMMELGATVCAPRAPRCSACPVAAHCAGLALQTAAGEASRPDEKPFLVTDVPEKEKKAPKREERVDVRVVEARVSVSRATGDESGDEEEHVGYLLTKRPEGGLLGGLWEFPSAAATAETETETETDRGDAARAGADRALAGFCSEVVATAARATPSARSVDADALVWSYAGAVTHVFSHVRQTMHVEKSAARVALAPGSDPGAFFRSCGFGSGGTEWRWVRAGDVESAGLSSGVLKVHALVTNGNPPKAPKARNGRKAVLAVAKTAPGNATVGEMFAAAKKKAKTEPRRKD